MNRVDHRRRLLFDRDVMHTGVVAGTLCLLSGGLVYLGYLVHVLRTAWRASCTPERGECLLLFGKHSPDGSLDDEFTARVTRTADVWRTHAPRRIVLLGGAMPGQRTEAELAHTALLAHGVDAAAGTAIHLETQSRDTLQNLRNARALLADAGHEGCVTLISSRYHLARCALFARQLGFDYERCAAEPALRLTPMLLLRLAGEAGYVCWIDIGTRWARLIGHQRMLGRVT